MSSKSFTDLKSTLVYRGEFMWIIFDAIVVIVMAISIYNGYKRGFVRTVFKFGIVIAAFMIAYNFSPVLEEYIKSTDLYYKITEDIKLKVSDNLFSQNEETQSPESDGKQTPLYYLFDGLGIDVKELQSEYDEMLKQGKDQAEDTVNNMVVVPICNMLVKAVSFAIIVVVSSVLLVIVMYLLELVFKLPLLNGFNRILGLVAAVASGCLKLFVICVIIQLVLPYISTINIGICCGIEDKTMLYKIIKDINPLAFMYR